MDWHALQLVFEGVLLDLTIAYRVVEECLNKIVHIFRVVFFEILTKRSRFLTPVTKNLHALATGVPHRLKGRPSRRELDTFHVLLRLVIKLDRLAEL